VGFDFHSDCRKYYWIGLLVLLVSIDPGSYYLRITMQRALFFIIIIIIIFRLSMQHENKGGMNIKILLDSRNVKQTFNSSRALT